MSIVNLPIESTSRRRASIDEVETILREEDGFEPGQTTVSSRLDTLSDLTLVPEVESFPDAHTELSQHIEENGSLEQYLEAADLIFAENDICFSAADYEILQKHKQQAGLLCRVGEIVSAISQSEASEEAPSRLSENQKQQHLVISRIAEDFLRFNPDAELDPSKPGSIAGLADFILFYNRRVHEELGTELIVEMVEANRGIVLEALQSEAIVRQLGRDGAARISQAVATQPLVISNPLLSLLEHSSSEPLAWFHASDRVSYIDPLSIKSKALNHSAFRAMMLKSMIHEFVHAATNSVYRIRPESEYSSGPNIMELHELWPVFFSEGMAEKIAYLIAVKAAPELFGRDKDSGFRPSPIEARLRTLFSDDPHEVMAPSYIKKARTYVESSYADYRLVIDTMIGNADWAAVGITRKQAEKLAIRAFLEVDRTSADLPNKARKDFMAALHGATHRGFMAKLGELVSVYGSFLALDVLESPDFDYKKGDHLPWLVNSTQRRRLSIMRQSYERDMERLAFLESVGAPDTVLASTRNVAEERAERAEQYEVLQRATRALAKILSSQFGTRRRSMNREEIITRSIYGIEPEPTVRQRSPLSEEEFALSQAAIDAWRGITRRD